MQASVQAPTKVASASLSVFESRRRFSRDRAGFLLDLAARDLDVLRIPWWGGLIKVSILSSADLAHEVLVEKEDAFVKGYGLSYFARPLLGNGLLTSEKDFHRRQRRMMAPAFVHKRIADYATVIAARADAAQRGLADGATVDVAPAMMRLTLEIVGATLFGAEVGPEADEIGAALTAALEHATRAIRAVIPIPPRGPRPPIAAASRPSPGSTRPSTGSSRSAAGRAPTRATSSRCSCSRRTRATAPS